MVPMLNIYQPRTKSVGVTVFTHEDSIKNPVKPMVSKLSSHNTLLGPLGKDSLLIQSFEHTIVLVAALMMAHSQRSVSRKSGRSI